MSTAAPLMPKATAVWLVDNTALSFDQIAEFCKLHPLEIKAIADGDAAQGIKGLDPVPTGQLTREQIAEAEADPTLKLQADRAEGGDAGGQQAWRQEGPALYAGVAPPGPAERHSVAGAQSSRTQGRADHAPGRHHQVDHRRRSATAPTGTPRALAPMDPVTLGLCSQIDLDFEVSRANKEKPLPVASGATCCRHPRPPPARKPKWPRLRPRSRSPAATSTSAPCSPSSSSSAARASRKSSQARSGNSGAASAS